jgi:DNA polymerase-3 subunit delta
MSSTQKPLHSAREILSQIENGKIKPAYFFYGSESYLVDSIISQIELKFLGDAQKEINYFLRYAPDTSIDEVLALCSGSGLFSTRKLVVYKDFQNLRNPNIKKMATHLEKTNPDICLVIIARTDQIKFTKYEQLQGGMIFVNVQPLQEKDLTLFVRKEFEENNKRITDEGIESLLFLVGNQIHDLKTEIVQVCNFYQEKNKIDAKDVEEIVGVFVNQNIFDYINAIAKKDLNQALFILHNLLERGESPFSFIALLLRHVSVLWKIYGMYRSGIKNDFEIGKKLGIYSRHFAEYKSQLSGWNEQQLKIAMHLIEECDRNLKSTQMRPDLILDILRYKMVNSKSIKK